MKTRLALFLLAFGSCFPCWCFACNRRPSPRYAFAFDIGGGRTVHVWSTRLGPDHWLDSDPYPLMVFYRIDANGRALATRTFMDHDDGKEYQFNVLVAEGGQLVCVYEVSRGSENGYMTILYDAGSGESWPRDRGLWISNPEIKRKWRERFERLQREHPSYRIPRHLLE
jgi:hypothetical protein